MSTSGTASAPVIAIFGAGIGLGAAVARRFGREGFRVALIGRRREPLERLATDLHAAGIDAAAFPADLGDPANVPALIDTIHSRLGRIDVVEYGPTPSEFVITPARELTAQFLQKLAGLYLFTPVEITRRVLPELIQRGSGSVLFTLAATGLQPTPGQSGAGTVQVAARHYIDTLAQELKGTGVHAATIAINALIKNSALASFAEANSPADTFSKLPTINPDELADLYWTLHSTHDRVAVVVPA